MKLPQSTNILLLGNGGRESAIAASIARSAQLGRLYIAPGNAGTAQWGTNVDINPLDFAMLKHFVVTNFINLVVVGPEEPLVRGIRDFFLADDLVCHVPVLGPSAAAAQLEGSKDFAKDFMFRHGVPTARSLTVEASTVVEGEAFLDQMRPPYVLKADGLAGGKGVLIIDDLDQAKRELKEMIFAKKFGDASAKVVIEEFLSGIECSVFVVTDGNSYKVLPVAKDYKRIGDGDTGLNTGGMGAVSPVPFVDDEFMRRVVRYVVEPTVNGIKSDGLDYKGFVFIGLIKCGDDPYVIEYNVRMGDPESQVVFPRIDSDIIDLFDGIINGTLCTKKLDISVKTAVTVVCTSGGYPGDFKKGFPITGLENSEDSVIFQGGTKFVSGEVVTSGGRVLSVTSLSSSIKAAAARSYATIEGIKYEGIYFRHDIGKDLL
ncbi:MAG: phosphoribosylamine--glycine ligase [Mucinivorans sp.]